MQLRTVTVWRLAHWHLTSLDASTNFLAECQQQARAIFLDEHWEGSAHL